MNRPELLAPAGDLEKLRFAFAYGADAAYLGGEEFGLRAMAGNFSLLELGRARDLAAAAGKKLYLTLNAFVRPAEMGRLEELLRELRPLELDAYIVSDPGVLALVRAVDPDRPLHLSTQANTGNAEAVNFWRAAGVSRVNLARELSLEEIRAIGGKTDMELEVFVHGAMCVALSGRCLLSAALTGRSANRGACTHPCRWRYSLVEETRPEEAFPIEEDARGTYLLNSRDLCLVDHLPELLGAGVRSLKIEGRMKGLYYVAVVTSVYRDALDRYLADPAGFRPDPAWRRELEKVSHRPYGRGFLFADDGAQVSAGRGGYLRGCDFLGVVEEILEVGRGVVEGRNRFFPGEELELIGPGGRRSSFEAGIPFGPEGEAREAVQPNLRVVMPLPPEARPGDLIRRPAPGEGPATT